MLSGVDRDWPMDRRPSDLHDWSWQGIASQSFETFAIVRDDTVVVSLWSTSASRLLELKDGLAYRLDFLEVSPLHRGVIGEAGAFTFGALAARAIECGAAQIVLGSLPEARRYYDELGGTQKLARGWKVASGLLPYTFARPVLQARKELIDELADEGE